MYPRPPTENELAILGKLLRDDGCTGAAAYRSQLPYVTVTGGCPCGCATIDLRVDPGAPVEPGPTVSPLRVEGVARDPGDPDLPLELLIFTEDGYLAMLEIVSYSELPRQFPPSDAVEVVTR